MAELPFDEHKVNRWFAVEYNNRAWNLVEAAERSTNEINHMIDLAHASCVHWRAVGTIANEVRGQCLLATAYALANRAEAAVRHAETCLQCCSEAGDELTPFDRASAHGSAANAYASAGDLVRAKSHYERALAAIAESGDAEDRPVFDRLYPPPAARRA